MARPLLQGQATVTSHTGAPPALPLVFLAAAVATVVVSLCTSGKHARPRKQSGSPPSPAPQDEDKCGGGGRNKQLLASLSGKAAAVAKMVSWNRRSSSPPAGGWSSDSDDDDDGKAATAGGAVEKQEEAALWKKTIIMGDKCRPLEFSGHIAYDSDGNRLPPAPAELIKKDEADASHR
ncbi:hypothetical protein ACP70R_031282 [Stipagrostis hirtigluma subsp. patula]